MNHKQFVFALIALLAVGAGYLMLPGSNSFRTEKVAAPVPVPDISDAAVASWGQQAVEKTMSFDYANHAAVLNEASRQYFTEDGWAGYSDALAASRMTQSMEQFGQSLATSADAATLVSKGGKNGDFAWVVEMPATLTFTAGEKTRTDKWKITLVIVPSAEPHHPEKIAISQWIAAPY